MYCLFDFDDVLTKKAFEGGSPKVYIDVMTVRKKYKIPFNKAVTRVLGSDKDAISEMIDNWYLNNVYNNHITSVVGHFIDHGYQLGIATNNCPQIVNTFLSIHKLNDEFPELNRFFPENLNMTWKPNKRYYRSICTYLQCDIEELSLVDDRYENVKALKKLGGNGYWYDVKNRRIHDAR